MKKSEVISFRLTSEEYQPYKELLDRCEESKSEFFRRVFLEGKVNIKLTERKPVEYSKLIFIANKASNNINQIAKRLNTDNKKGTLSDVHYIKAINELISINQFFKGVIDACED